MTIPVLTANNHHQPPYFLQQNSTGRDELHLCLQGSNWNGFSGAGFGLSDAGWSRQIEGDAEISTGLAHASYFTSFNVFILISCPAKACKGCTSEMSTGECQSHPDSGDGDGVC